MRKAAALPGANRRQRGAAKLVKADPEKVAEIARQYTPTAMRTLVAIAENGESETARVAAARALLDYGYGRPAVQVEVNTTSIEQVVYESEEEYRQALLQRGVPPRLLPPAIEAKPSRASAPESQVESEENNHAISNPGPVDE